MLSRTPVRPIDPVLGRVDAALFTGPMLLIGPDNAAVGIVDGHEAAALAIARGHGTTWAAQVRPGVIALDVDLAHAGLAELVLDDLIGWCRRRGLWHVTRPSGGGPGRHHLVVVPGHHEAALLDAIDAWRSQLKVSRQALDVRAAIRPLSAPHRTGRRAPAPLLADNDLDALRAALQTVPRRSVALRPSASLAGPLRIVPTERSGPFQLPQAPECAGDGSRSAAEFVQTLRLANAGATADQAWALISAISGGKSARRGRSWWERYVWSRVRAPQAANGFDLSALVLPVMAASRPLYAALDTRSRHSLETVLMAILERLDRTSQRPVPLSERDLVLATGLSRPTIRAAGVRAVQLGILTRTRDARQDAAWVWALAERSATASLTCPSILTPRPSRWLHGCPAGSATALLDHHLAGPPGRQPSTRQAALRLAQLDALRKHHALGEPGPTPAATTDGWHARLAQVTAERDQFYAGLRAAREARQAPYHRRILARRQRQLAWWHALSPAEQDARRVTCRDRLAQLDAGARHAHIARLRDQRQLLRRLTRQHPTDAAQTALPIPTGVLNPVPS